MLFKIRFLKKIDYFLLFITILIILILSLLFFNNPKLLSIMLILIGIIIIEILILQIYRRLSKNLECIIQINNIKLVETFRKEINKLSGEIFVNTLNLYIPPLFSDWTLDGDLLKIIIDEIYLREKINILELGSGASTIVISRILKSLNKGMLYSIEHDVVFYNKTKKLLLLNGLEDICKLYLSPIEKVIINNEEFLWYDTKFINKIDLIDMLIIDGPPIYLGKMSRFPALPLLIEKLNSNCIIFLDDAFRDEEKNIIKKWMNLYSNFHYQTINTSKGALKITI